MPKILIVDDEEPLRASLSYVLTREGYSVSTAVDGPSALQSANVSRPDLVILDLMLPGLDGMEVCRRLRATSDVPVIMLTAKDLGRDKVEGLNTGADDYVTKPFDTPELMARVKAVLRRRQSAERLLEEDRQLMARMEALVQEARLPRLEEQGARIEVGSRSVLDGDRVVVDLEAGAVLVDGQPVAISAAEYSLLRILLAYAGRVVTRTELIEHVWGSGAQDGYTLLAVHMRCLREKIEADPAHPRLLSTVPGIGFRLDPNGSP